MRFSNIIKKAASYLPSLDERRLWRTYNLAKKAHQGQKRKDGEPYLSHPIAVADILTDLYADEDTLVAALLHDVVEDTTYTIAQIGKIFGKNVLNLVDGVTVLNKALYPFDKKTRKVESLKKFFRLSKKDLRVILIKLADRLHNMRTVKALTDKRRIKLATENMDIYIPIANLLGIWKIKNELEDLSFECLKTTQFKKIRELRRTYLEETKEISDKTVKLFSNALKQNGFRATIVPQDRSLLYYYLKYSATGNRNETFRNLSFNVIVPRKLDCYTVLGILHALFKPRYSRIKDYIATPKANNYRSLHTVVFGVNGIPTSFRIRTAQMHKINEYGILSNIHKYSVKNPQKASLLIREKTKWLQKVLEISDELPSDQNFLNSLKMDVLNNRIFAFTPKGDIIDLPEGATILDFAYALHSDIGDRTRGAEVDGLATPLSQQLQTGDTVKIVTGEKPAPKLEWLNLVRTNEAKHKIKTFFKQEGSDKSYKAGKRLLEQTLEHFQKTSLADVPSEKTANAVKEFGADNLKDLMIMIGKGEVLPRNVLNAIYSKEEMFRRKSHSKGKKTTHELYAVQVLIGFRDRIGLFRDIATTVSRYNVNIVKIFVKNPGDKGKEGQMELTIEIRELDELMDILTALEQIQNITYARKK